MMSLDSLYLQVSEAIDRAETLEKLGLPTARTAFHEVSTLEERIAGLLPAAEAQGTLARRGAVRAALKAKEFSRARELVKAYCADPEAPAEVRAGLVALEKEGFGPLMSRMARAIKAHDIDGLLRLVTGFDPLLAPFPVPSS